MHISCPVVTGQLFLCADECLHINSRIHEVYILLIQFLPKKLHCLAETLEVDDLTLPEELDYIVYIRVIRQTQDVVVGHTGLLFSCIYA